MSLRIQLDQVADLSDPAEQKRIDTNEQELTGAWVNAGGGAPTQTLGAALLAVPELEGFIFPSAKAGSHCLALFMDKLGARSTVTFHNELDNRTEILK
jgi:hypothetical protein